MTSASVIGLFAEGAVRRRGVAGPIGLVIFVLLVGAVIVLIVLLSRERARATRAEAEATYFRQTYGQPFGVGDGPGGQPQRRGSGQRPGPGFTRPEGAPPPASTAPPTAAWQPPSTPPPGHLGSGLPPYPGSGLPPAPAAPSQPPPAPLAS